MPLDRRINVRTRVEETDDFGRPFDPPQYTDTNRRVWATRTDKTAQRVVDEGGATGTTKRTYRLRWRSDILAAAQDQSARVLTEDDLELAIENVITATDRGPLAERRRFLELEVSGVTN